MLMLAELLRFCAFLAPDGIPEELFTESAKVLSPTLEPVVSYKFRLNEAISGLLMFSLLNRDFRHQNPQHAYSSASSVS